MFVAVVLCSKEKRYYLAEMVELGQETRMGRSETQREIITQTKSLRV